MPGIQYVDLVALTSDLWGSDLLTLKLAGEPAGIDYG